MKFYADLLIDQSVETLHFEVEADSAHQAFQLLAAYGKGRFEASGHGTEIERLAKAKSRGVEYRRL